MSANQNSSPFSPHSFHPSRVVLVDLEEPIPALSTQNPKPEHGSYRQATVLGRLHGQPIGLVLIDLPQDDDSVEAGALAAELWQKLGNEINTHLENDGLPRIDTLNENGLGSAEAPACWDLITTNDNLPLVSIVIATRDRPVELERNLRTIQQLQGPLFEVIVVDNAATTDATEKMVKEKFTDDPRIRYVSQAQPGISPARNRGIREAKGDVIAFTDDDVLTDRYWIQALLRSLLTNPQADAVTGLVMPAELETPSQHWFEEYGGFNKGYAPRLFTRKREEGDSMLYPFTGGSYGSGNNMAFRRETLDRLGGFDERLGVGSPVQSGEDLDLFMAVVVGGGMIAYEPAAIISHFHREDYEGLRKQLYNYGLGLSALYVKWFTRRPIDVLRRIPRGIWFLLSPKSGKNENRSESFPRELVKTELKGMLRGPIALFKSYRQAARK